ncbi:hypothetical protein KUCAC02_022062 [Chaenocephalus aceratus]|nr:hypothetical protein KUCAC02_022062 [Chaenocephalus aceratus]
MLQADDEDDAMDQQMKSPFGSSFRTFDATDYKPIGRLHFLLDTVCRLYEVGRHKLVEEGDDDDDQVRQTPAAMLQL